MQSSPYEVSTFFDQTYNTDSESFSAGRMTQSLSTDSLYEADLHNDFRPMDYPEHDDPNPDNLGLTVEEVSLVSRESAYMPGPNSASVSKGDSMSQFYPYHHHHNNNPHLPQHHMMGADSFKGNTVIQTFSPNDPGLSLDFLGARRHSYPFSHSSQGKRYHGGVPPQELTIDTKLAADIKMERSVQQLAKEITMTSLAPSSISSGSPPSSKKCKVETTTPVLTLSIAPKSEESTANVFDCDAQGPDSPLSEGSFYEGSDSMDEEEYPNLPPAPNTKVIDCKPRRGGRHKKDGKPREELLPPPSPRTLSDPDLMQEYRQERNRLAAKRSRERKKDYIGKLEATCKALKAHSDDLGKELLRTKRELNDLKGKGRRKSITSTA